MTSKVPFALLNENTQAALTAFRNKLINADFKINQRGYASGGGSRKRGIAGQCFSLDSFG